MSRVSSVEFAVSSPRFFSRGSAATRVVLGNSERRDARSLALVRGDPELLGLVCGELVPARTDELEVESVSLGSTHRDRARLGAVWTRRAYSAALHSGVSLGRSCVGCRVLDGSGHTSKRGHEHRSELPRGQADIGAACIVASLSLLIKMATGRPTPRCVTARCTDAARSSPAGVSCPSGGADSPRPLLTTEPLPCAAVMRPTSPCRLPMRLGGRGGRESRNRPCVSGRIRPL